MASAKRIIFIVTLSLIGTLALATMVPFSIYGFRSAGMKSDYAYLKADAKYSLPAKIEGFHLVTQHISCGYASIEMMSTYYGHTVTEDELSAKHNGGISTSSSNGFMQELSESIPSKTFIKESYLKNDVLLKNVHDSLSAGNPVAIEWAALYEGQWTLHFSVVSGIDLGQGNVTVYNPYGYIESLAVETFISRTTFEAYKDIPFFLSFGFAFGAFEKNAIFYAK